MKISTFKHHKQLKYPNGRLMPFNAPLPKINFNSQGVSKFSRVPYLFQCSFFSVHHHLAGPGNFINFFSSAVRTANKGTRNTHVEGVFFKEKSTENHIRESPLDLHSSIVSGFETQQDGSQFFFKCKFEQHYTFCHHTIYVG